MAGGLLSAKEDRRNTDGEMDKPFLALTLLLLALGLAALYSASSAQSAYDTGYAITTRYLQKQAVCAALGLGAMYGFSRVPARVWYRLAWPGYILSIVLLLSVLVVGQQVNGARRWINIMGLQFQPSEVAKFTLILLLSKLTKDYGENASQFRYGVLGFGMAILGILVPLALEKHLSAIMLLGMVAVVMMYIAGTNPKWLILGIVIVKVSLPVWSRCSSSHRQMRPRRLLQHSNSRRQSSEKYFPLIVSSQFRSSFQWAALNSPLGRSIPS